MEFGYRRMNKTLHFTDAHKHQRIELAREQELSTFIFSDEIQFNLDGPDGCNFE